jgi:flagellar biosynthesis protein FlhG
VTDQASVLRRMMRSEEERPAFADATDFISVGPAQRRPKVRLAKAWAIVSGKGGVGKTNLSVNLAIALAATRRICLLDADFGLANADVLCSLTPQATLEDVLLRGRSLEEVMVAAPGGFRLLPGASGVASLADLSAQGRRRLLEELARLERSTDLLLVDTAAGIAANTMAFAAAAHCTLVAVTPEPTSIADAYGAIKTLLAKRRRSRIRLVVNMANDRAEGEEVFRRIDRVARTFLDAPLELAGIVPYDDAVRASVRKRMPLLLAAPEAPAARAIRALARGLVAASDQDEEADGPVGVDPEAFLEARAGFLGRFVGWLGRR